jgi:hypothetical protein
MSSTLPRPKQKWLALPMVEEHPRERRSYQRVAFLVAAAYLGLVLVGFVPSLGNPGVDEDAYLGGGKNIARHLTLGVRPGTPFEFMGPMWLRTADGWFYPKYPLGVSVLHALAIGIGLGNVEAAFYTSPFCSALAVLAMFFLTRMLAGSTMGIVSAILLATNPTMAKLAIEPNSHAPVICFTLWGMVALLTWWKSRRTGVGIAAGALLGYAVTVRSSEVLLFLPMALVAYSALRLRLGGSWLKAAVPLAVWGLIIAAMVTYNEIAFGQPTGYNATLESTGFTLEEFGLKWEQLLANLHLYGLFFLLPLGALGISMLLAFAPSWGLVMALWAGPVFCVCAAFYWGGQQRGIPLLRLVLTLYPPLIASAMWLVRRVFRAVGPEREGRALRAGRASAIVLFASMVAGAGIYVDLPILEDDAWHATNAMSLVKTMREWIPEERDRATRGKGARRPIFFSDDSGSLSGIFMQLHYFFDGEWYSVAAFDEARTGPKMYMTVKSPGLLDSARVNYMDSVYRQMTPSQLRETQARIIREAIASGRGVYVTLRPERLSDFCQSLVPRGLDCAGVRRWRAPLILPVDRGSERKGLGLSTRYGSIRQDSPVTTMDFARIVRTP